MPDLNAFTGSDLDRAADRRRRDSAWVAGQRAHPAARGVVAGDAGVAASRDRLELVPLTELDGRGEHALLLGLDATGPVFAFDEDRPVAGASRPPLIGAGGRRGEPPVTAPGRVALREAAARLSQADGGLAAYATALLNWHRSHRFCANCGSPTEVAEAGLVRCCPGCGVEHHPRTDPVVIMLVEDGDRLMLGRQATWPARRYSALAGFVGQGESLEEAVAREVAEESGVRVDRPRYVSSQPWPFPASLMLGFVARWAGGEAGQDSSDDELEDVRWFTRAEVEHAVEVSEPLWDAPEAETDGDLMLPPRSAIARRLIEAWIARRLPGSASD